MSIPIYGESSTQAPPTTPVTSPSDTILQSAMAKAVIYLTNIESTKNKDFAVEALNTLILTVTNELSKLK
jgi:hypothetical protein